MDYEYADDSVFLYLLNSQESDADVANAYPNLPNATFFCRVPINSIILGLQFIIRTYKKVGFGRLRQGFKAEGVPGSGSWLEVCKPWAWNEG